MHGWEGENRKRSGNRHMLKAPSRALRTTTVVNGDSSFSASANYFFKDDRKISVGDCALFRPSIESPPFIGIIRGLTSNKENNLKLGVNWLYRPSEVKLGKDAAFEAAPNEVFYSFHRDEIPAASILHPCKVAFLPRGVELPSGVSAFVCRRVYDVEHECLWWLTDQDYINERQEEVDKLLHRTRREMHATAQHQQGARSPKPVNGSTAMSPSKQSPDSMQNSSSSFPSQTKGKKRDRVDQASEPMKRERSSKVDDGESRLAKSDNSVKSEIAKMTEKGGLVDSDAVERLVQLMQPDRPERKVDLSCRSMLAGIVASTDNHECLCQFVQLRGLPVLDEWLQEAHKGKSGDSCSPRGNDKSLEDFMLVLLCALDKLPVNLDALQTCNIGKSVNHLRTHKNLEIQKKARSLVDTWKKRVEVEMNLNDTRSGSNHGVPWSARSRHEVSHGSSRHLCGSSEAAMRSSVSQLSSSRSGAVKVFQGDPSQKPVLGSLGPHKSPSSPASATSNCKDGQARISAVSGSSEPQPTAREEKSSSSSQSHTNSQCSSDHAKNIIPSGKEDARSSTAGSRNMNKIKGSGSRHRKSANGFQTTIASTAHRESGSGRHTSPKVSPSEKLMQSIINSEHSFDASPVEGNNHKLIVKITNRGRSPAQSVNGGAVDPSNRNSRASSPSHPEKHDQTEASFKEKDDIHPPNEGDSYPGAAHDRKHSETVNDPARVSEGPNSICLTATSDVKMRKSVHSSLNSMTAFIESCVKYSETNASMSVGDDVGMNLLASVAAGEISNVSALSPAVSPQQNTLLADKSRTDNDDISRSNDSEAGKRSLSSGDDLKKDVEACVKNEEILDESSGDLSIHVSSASAVAKNSGADDQVPLEEASLKDEIHDPVPDTRRTVCIALIPGDGNKEEEAQRSPVKDLKVCNADVEDVKNDTNQGQNKDVPVEHKPPAQVTCSESVCTEEQSKVSFLKKHSIPGDLKEQKTEDLSKVSPCNIVDQVAEKRPVQDTNDLSNTQKQEESCPCPAGSDQEIPCKDDNLERKEAVAHHSNKKEALSTTEIEPHHISGSSKLIASGGERKDERASTAVEASSASAKSTGPDVKMEFDLNEGLNVDDGKNGDPAALSALHRPPALSFSSPLQLSMYSASCSLPAPVAVAASAKGPPFVPPEDLLRNKSELGWKGSAATSAFRPAEPRTQKGGEILLGSNRSPLPDATAIKQVKFEFDLNVPDERVLQDSGCQGSGQEAEQKLEHKSEYQNTNDSSSFVSLRGSGCLDLDLNKADEAPESGQHATGNGQRLAVSAAPINSLSSGLPNGEANAKRDFDLNDGPAADEVVVEPPLFNQHAGGNILPQATFGLRVNSTTMPSWFSPGPNYPAVATPSAMPDRGEQPFPIVGFGGGAQRILAGPTPSTSFNPDVFRGSVLTSSPAMAFPAAPFQYPVFPFGASFPLPAPTLGGSPAFIDPSSTGRMAVPTLLGNAAAISTHHPRPCVVSLPDVNNNGGVDNSRRWVMQGLDLNCGPGGPEVEGREDSFAMSSRQFSAISSQSLGEDQARMFHVAAGGMKRKEPERGRDSDRLNYKQSSWQ